MFDEDVHDDDDSMGRATVSVLDLVENKPKMLSVKLRDYDEGGMLRVIPALMHKQRMQARKRTQASSVDCSMTRRFVHGDLAERDVQDYDSTEKLISTNHRQRQGHRLRRD